MKILYLHGLGSKVGGEKVDWLRKEGHDVYNPKLNFQNPNCFAYLKIYCNRFEAIGGIDIIIGSSMGGYFAYELGKHYDVPVILLNPALHSRNFEPEIDSSGQFDPYVILGVGEKDDVIDYKKTLEILDDEAACFFRPNYFKGTHGHRTPVDFFKKVFFNNPYYKEGYVNA